MPENIDDRTGVDSARGSVSQGEMRSDGGEDGELNYQEKVTVIWIEKVKAMGSHTLDGIEGGRGSAEDRMILTDMSNVGMFEGVNKTASNLPVKVISSDIRTLGGGN